MFILGKDYESDVDAACKADMKVGAWALVSVLLFTMAAFMTGFAIGYQQQGQHLQQEWNKCVRESDGTDAALQECDDYILDVVEGMQS